MKSLTKMVSKIMLGLLLVAFVTAADANAWRSRTVYQLLTDRFWRSNGDKTTGCNLRNYCGGDWEGVRQQLSYIKELGFNAIWISPTVDNEEGAYHGYAYRNWEKVNSRFGDEKSLKRMIDTAHSMDIWVMTDVVANHVAAVGSDFSSIYPFNQASHYHKTCQITDFDNQWQVENCRLFDLPDLDQSNPFVKQYLNNWIKQQVTKFGFDGIRIDTARHIEKKFWPEYCKAAGVYTIGEVYNENDAFIGDYQNYIDSLLNFGMFFTIKNVFGAGQSMRQIATRWASINKAYKNPDVLGLFVENHDNPRFLHLYPDIRSFKSATAFGLTARGIPFFYYGGEQGFRGGEDPGCREPLWNSMNKQSDMFKFVQTINRARQAQGVASQPFAEKWVDDNLYAFTRGKFFVALTNRLNQQVNVDVPNTGFKEGELLCNIFYMTDCVKITGGKLPVHLNYGEVKIFIPATSAFIQSKGKSLKQILLQSTLTRLQHATKF